jgi:hypothetical protein
MYVEGDFNLPGCGRHEEVRAHREERRVEGELSCAEGN